MEILEGVAIGSIMGLLAGIWLVASLVQLYRTLAQGKASAVASAAALFTLPGFMGGGTWVTAKLYAPLTHELTLAAYFCTAALLISAINAWPGFRIVRWCAAQIGRDL